MAMDTDAKMNRREWIAGGLMAGVPFAGAGLLGHSVVEALPPAGGSLKARATAKGLYFGCALDIPEVNNDQQLRAAAAADCNMLVPGNGFNWTRVQPTQDAPLDFSQVDPVYALAQAAGAKMRCHDLVYDKTTPKWVEALVPTLSAKQAGDLLTGYIQKVATAWAGKVVHYEVVNEPAYVDVPGYRHNPFLTKLGEGYMDLAFHATRAADPNALLFTNAAAIEQDHPVFDAFRGGMLRLLERLLKRGVPIQGLGIEGHITGFYPFSERKYADFLHEVTQMGLKLMVTEFDVNDRGFPGQVPARDTDAAALAKSFLDVSLSFRECVGVITWSMTDRYTWLHEHGTEDRQRADHQALRPGLYDTGYQKKPMWNAIAAALDAAPNR
jgi:endo-1,4-beta-xylanase